MVRTDVEPGTVPADRGTFVAAGPEVSATVVVQHIITKDTMDERILDALRTKDKTQSALIDAVKADLKS